MSIGAKALANEAKERAIPLLVSFETGEQVTNERVYPPPSVDWELCGVRYEVVKALGATDAGTIDLKMADGTTLAITQISIPASSPAGTRGSGTLSTTVSRLRAGAGQANAYHGVTTAKPTAGGRVRLWLYYRLVKPNAP